MAALRFRFAPPTAIHGARGDLALTINADHSVGAGSARGALDIKRRARRSAPGRWAGPCMPPAPLNSLAFLIVTRTDQDLGLGSQS